MIDHDALRDSIAALALGVLDQSESVQVRAHLATCDECEHEYAELRPVANLVGLSAEASASELDEVSSRRMRAALRAAIAPPAAAKPSPESAARPRSTQLAYGLAVAAILIASLTAINSASLQSQHTLDTQRIAELQKEINSKERASEYDRAALADLFSRDSERYPVKGGEVVRHGDKIYLAMWALPATQSGHVYQAWLKTSDSKGMLPSVTFRPNGKGFAIVRLPGTGSNVEIVAVSVEPEGGSKAPTTTPTFVQKIT